jgi:ATP-dependent DNA ligase
VKNHSAEAAMTYAERLIEVRKATLASILRKSRPGVRLNEHLEHPDGLTVFQHACKMGLEGIVSKRLGSR